jgi:predicted DNA-binding protein
MQKFFGLKIEESLLKKLNSIAIVTKRSKAFLIKEALKEHLDDLELAYRADKMYEDVCTGRIKTIPQEEIEKEYGFKQKRTRL